MLEWVATIRGQAVAEDPDSALAWFLVIFEWIVILAYVPCSYESAVIVEAEVAKVRNTKDRENPACILFLQVSCVHYFVMQHNTLCAVEATLPCQIMRATFLK
jgi:hypothetical protein